MKKILLIILLVITSTSVFAQCKFKKDEIDEFTKNKIRETKDFQIAGVFSQAYGVQLRQVNERYYLKLTYSTLGAISMIIREGDELMFKLKNDSIISIQSIEMSIAERHYSKQANSTTIKCNYSITKEDLQILSQNPVVKMRYYTSEGYIEKDLSENGAERLLEFSGCIIN